MTSKYALVIANTDYQDTGLAKLTAPGKDAEEFARILREPDRAGFDDVQVLLDESVEKTRRAVARFFSNRKPDDLLLMYFSGHGVRNDVGQLFLAAHDTEIDLLDATGLPAEFITNAMNNSRSRRQLLILDCCNSGAFAHGTKSSAVLGQSMGTAQAFEGNGFGRIVLTATDSTQYAWEGEKVLGNTQQSVFTHFLIEGLNGEANRDGDGKITVDELYDYAYEQVVSRTPKQTPGKWSYKQQGELVLRDNLKPREVKPARLSDEIIELLASPSQRSRNLAIQDLAELLDGKHPGLVRAAEEKLREITANDDSLSLRKTASDILAAHKLSPDLVETPAPVSSLPVERAPEQAPVKPAPRIETKKPAPPSGTVQRVKPAIPAWALFGCVGLFALAVISFSGWKIYNLTQTRPASTPTVMVLPTPTVMPTAMSLLTKFPAPTIVPTAMLPTAMKFPTPTIVPTAMLLSSASLTPSLGVGSTWNSPKDSMTMLYIPAGDFSMGSETGAADEKPVHTVYLDSYWMDQTEVTNAMFAKCFQAGKCNEPWPRVVEHNYFKDPVYADHPVMNVSWNDANAYCEWRGDGTRLPTEAEWEKAASWDDARKEKRVYPWGDSKNCSFANYNGCVGVATKVGSYPSGASFYGLLDMAGNAGEWVADWYAAYPGNTVSDSRYGTKFRVLRGGAWYASNYRSASRDESTPDSYFNFVGFRCARSQ
jgi:formylglycine-generating enzyme required for sulfatase activity